jgi:hypothetical protein
LIIKKKKNKKETREQFKERGLKEEDKDSV